MSLFTVIPQGPFESNGRKQLSPSSCGWVLISSGQFKITSQDPRVRTSRAGKGKVPGNASTHVSCQKGQNPRNREYARLVPERGKSQEPRVRTSRAREGKVPGTASTHVSCRRGQSPRNREYARLMPERAKSQEPRVRTSPAGEGKVPGTASTHVSCRGGQSPRYREYAPLVTQAPAGTSPTTGQAAVIFKPCRCPRVMQISPPTTACRRSLHPAQR